jgi:hypothetical protein
VLEYEQSRPMRPMYGTIWLPCLGLAQLVKIVVYHGIRLGCFFLPQQPAAAACCPPPAGRRAGAAAHLLLLLPPLSPPLPPLPGRTPHVRPLGQGRVRPVPPVRPLGQGRVPPVRSCVRQLGRGRVRPVPPVHPLGQGRVRSRPALLPGRPSRAPSWPWQGRVCPRPAPPGRLSGPFSPA